MVCGSASYVVLEYADRGDLYHSIVKRRRRLQYYSEETVWSMFTQICEGLAFLHENSVVHRDIKVGQVYVLHVRPLTVIDMALTVLVMGAHGSRR